MTGELLDRAEGRVLGFGDFARCEQGFGNFTEG